jgi:hypothetical protein
MRDALDACTAFLDEFAAGHPDDERWPAAYADARAACERAADGGRALAARFRADLVRIVIELHEPADCGPTAPCRACTPNAPPDVDRIIDAVRHLRGQRDAAQAEAARLTALVNTPGVDDFVSAMRIEVAHQRERWGDEHDDQKSPEDWYWTLGYLGGKALQSARGGDIEKALHHTITAAALLAQWHRRLHTGRGALGASDG